jgi:hypothetical protein
MLCLKLVVPFSGPARGPGLNWLHNSLAVQFHDRDAHSIIRCMVVSAQGCAYIHWETSVADFDDYIHLLSCIGMGEGWYKHRH